MSDPTLLHDLQAPLVGARVQAVHQPDDATVVLETHRTGAGAAHWLFSVQAETARFGRCFAHPRRSSAPPVFCQWLRTRLEGARITGLTLRHPQVLDLALERGPMDGPADAPADGPARFHLVLELNRRESNLLLLDGAERLLMALRHPGLPGRKLGPGEPYRMPPTLYPWPVALPLAERYPLAEEAAARALERIWQVREQAAALESRRKPALQAVRRDLKRLERRQIKMAQDLAQAREAELWRRRGELLQIHRAALLPGLASVRVPDVFEPEAPTVEIPLDARADAGANIERCFRRYRKLREAGPHVEERIAATAQEHAQWQALARQIEDARTPAQLEAIAAALPTGTRALRGLLRGEAPVTAQAQEPRGPLRRVSSDGWMILVGRSKEENDQVTFRLARGRDWWLHVQGWGGSHVIVVSPAGAAPPAATLREAAWLAGYYSQARAAGKVDVDYAQRKYVRKQKGGEPGQVTYSQHKTLLVDLEDATLRGVLERVEESA